MSRDKKGALPFGAGEYTPPTQPTGISSGSGPYGGSGGASSSAGPSTIPASGLLLIDDSITTAGNTDKLPPPDYDDITNTKPYPSDGPGIPTGFDDEGPRSSTPPPQYDFDPTLPPPSFSTYVPETHSHYLNSHLVTHDPHLNTDGEALYRFLLEQTYNPPRQLVRIRGYHKVTTRKTSTNSNGGTTTTTSTKNVDDFLFQWDLTSALEQVVLERVGRLPPGQDKARGELKVVSDAERVYRGGRLKSIYLATDGSLQLLGRQSPNGGRGTSSSEMINHSDMEAQLPPRVIADSVLSIRTWADRYCHLPTTFKEFIVQKRVTNLDQAAMTTHITNTIRETTNYVGRIEVTFPKTHHKIAIYPSTTFSRLRQNPYVRWFFYLTFLWVITWPILFFITKKFHIAVIEWRWGFIRNPATGELDTHATSSEMAWVSTWRDVIRLKCRQRAVCRGDEVLGAGDYIEARELERRKRRAAVLAVTRGWGDVESVVGHRGLCVAVGIAGGLAGGAVGGFGVGRAWDLGLEEGEVSGWGRDR